MPDHPAGRRFAGTVTAADDDTVTLALDEPVGESLVLRLDDIEKARTTFEWGPAPKPGGPKGAKGQKGAASSKSPKNPKPKASSPSTTTSTKKVQP